MPACTSALLASLALVVVLFAQPAAAEPVTYRPPVEVPVTDPFRPPPRPWMAGNRGVEYSLAAGTPVASAGRGTVTFAGPVAGSLHVTVTHPDGLRTSYSHLSSVSVVRGQSVEGGAVLGRSGTVLHWGVREPDGTYIDPLSLLGRPRGAVLVAGGDDGALPGRNPPGRNPRGRGETPPPRVRPEWVTRLFAPFRTALTDRPPALGRMHFGPFVEAP